jgi:hypothetical protein
VDKPKIAFAEIEKLERLLDDTPAHRADALSKREAVIRLAPRLHELHARGYSWRAVAQWLTDHGLAVTHSMLGGYLRRVPDPTARAPARRLKARHAVAARGASMVTVEPASPPRDSMLAEVPPLPGSHSLAAPAKQAPVRLVPAGSQAGSRRSDFAVRPDSEDI